MLPSRWNHQPGQTTWQSRLHAKKHWPSVPPSPPPTALRSSLSQRNQYPAMIKLDAAYWLQESGQVHKRERRQYMTFVGRQQLSERRRRRRKSWRMWASWAEASIKHVEPGPQKKKRWFPENRTSAHFTGLSNVKHKINNYDILILNVSGLTFIHSFFCWFPTHVPFNSTSKAKCEMTTRSLQK